MQAFVAWMEDAAVEGHPAADFLVRYHLLRQRFLEAKHAFACLQPATGHLSAAWNVPQNVVIMLQAPSAE